MPVNFHRNKKCETCGGSGARPGSSPETCGRCGGRGQVVQSAGILRVQTTCPSCQGAGQTITDPCTTCRGQGATQERVQLDVAIPAGIDDGMRVRLPGEGEPSPNGGPHGDCYCFVHVREHKLFKRDGQHLFVELPITYSQAALGAEVDVPTLRGRQEIEIPHGTASGEVFRIRGGGMPDPRGGRAVGELIVQAFIEVPKRLDKQQEELLRKLAQAEQANVAPQRKSFLGNLRDYFSSNQQSANKTEG